MSHTEGERGSECVGLCVYFSYSRRYYDYYFLSTPWKSIVIYVDMVLGVCSSYVYMWLCNSNRPIYIPFDLCYPSKESIIIANNIHIDMYLLFVGCGCGCSVWIVLELALCMKCRAAHRWKWFFAMRNSVNSSSSRFPIPTHSLWMQAGKISNWVKCMPCNALK